MKLSAISMRTRMVSISGRRLQLLSAHSSRNSGLRFFFITIALRKGAMRSTVSRPVRPLAYKFSSEPGSSRRVKGSTKVNTMAIVAEERMEYTSVLTPICTSSGFHRLFC